jgi:hypothetical protein
MSNRSLDILVQVNLSPPSPPLSSPRLSERHDLYHEPHPSGLEELVHSTPPQPRPLPLQRKPACESSLRQILDSLPGELIILPLTDAPHLSPLSAEPSQQKRSAWHRPSYRPIRSRVSLLSLLCPHLNWRRRGGNRVVSWDFFPDEQAVLLDKMYKFESTAIELGGMVCLLSSPLPSPLSPTLSVDFFTDPLPQPLRFSVLVSFLPPFLQRDLSQSGGGCSRHLLRASHQS